MAFFSRGNNKIKVGYTLPKMYESYIKDIEVGSPYDISYSTYVSITTTYINKIVERLFEGFRVTLPYRLGVIQVVKKKMYFKSQLTKGKGIDWAATNKYGKVIHHLNEHSDGYKYLFNWDRRGSRIKNIHSYKFIPTRTLKRTLASLIKKEKRDYFEAA